MTFVPPTGPAVEGRRRSSSRPSDPLHLHRAELPVPHGQPDRDERLRRPVVHGAATPTARRSTIITAVHHDGPDVGARRVRRPAPRRSSASRARSSASSRSSTPAPTRSSATTCRGAAATAWSTATARSWPRRSRSRTRRRRARARHRLARVLSRLERRADPPGALEPFDFEEANMSGELWIAEGFTQYYGDLVLGRAGLRAGRADHAGLANGALAVATHPGAAVPLGGADEPARAVQRRRRGRSTTRTSATRSSATTPTARALALALDLELRDAVERHALARRLHARDVEGARQAGRPAARASSRSRTRMQDARDRLAEVSGDRAFADELLRRATSKGARRPTTRRCSRAAGHRRPQAQRRARAWTGLRMDREDAVQGRRARRRSARPPSTRGSTKATSSRPSTARLSRRSRRR